MAYTGSLHGEVLISNNKERLHQEQLEEILCLRVWKQVDIPRDMVSYNTGKGRQHIQRLYRADRASFNRMLKVCNALK